MLSQTAGSNIQPFSCFKVSLDIMSRGSGWGLQTSSSALVLRFIYVNKKIIKGMIEMGILGPQTAQHSFTYSMLCNDLGGGEMRGHTDQTVWNSVGISRLLLVIFSLIYQWTHVPVQLSAADSTFWSSNFQQRKSNRNNKKSHSWSTLTTNSNTAASHMESWDSCSNYSFAVPLCVLVNQLYTQFCVAAVFEPLTPSKMYWC